MYIFDVIFLVLLMIQGLIMTFSLLENSDILLYLSLLLR